MQILVLYTIRSPNLCNLVICGFSEHYQWLVLRDKLTITDEQKYNAKARIRLYDLIYKSNGFYKMILFSDKVIDREIYGNVTFHPLRTRGLSYIYFWKQKLRR